MWKQLKDAYTILFPPKGFKWSGFVEPQNQPELPPGETTVYRGNFIPGTDAIGDGNAEFLGEGSSEEFDEQEKKDKGQHGIFGIGK